MLLLAHATTRLDYLTTFFSLADSDKAAVGKAH